LFTVTVKLPELAPQFVKRALPVNPFSSKAFWAAVVSVLQLFVVQ
jgi:hypothetical protein